MDYICKKAINRFRCKFFANLLFRQLSLATILILLAMEIAFFFNLNISVTVIIGILYMSVLLMALVKTISLSKTKIIHSIDRNEHLKGSLITLYESKNNCNQFINKISSDVKNKLDGANLLKTSIAKYLATTTGSAVLLFLITSVNNMEGSVDKSVDANSPQWSLSKEPPQIDFIAIPSIGYAPLTVIFQHRADGKLSDIKWSFGNIYTFDGGRSSDENPVYTYNLPGIYSVSLNAKLNGHNVSKIKKDLVIVEDRSASNIGGSSMMSNSQKENKNTTDDHKEQESSNLEEFKSKPLSVKIPATLQDRIKKEIELMEKSNDENSENTTEHNNQLLKQQMLGKTKSIIIPDKIPTKHREFLRKYYSLLSEQIK